MTAINSLNADVGQELVAWDGLMGDIKRVQQQVYNLRTKLHIKTTQTIIKRNERLWDRIVDARKDQK